MYTDKSKNHFVCVINKVAAISMLVGMSILVFVAVILRYVFAIAIRWSDELTRFMFIYLVFLGIPIAYRKKLHISIEFFTSILPSRLQKWLSIAISIIIAALITIVAIASLPIIFGQVGRTLAPGLKCPRCYIYAAVPIGMFLLLVEIISRLIKRERN